VNPLVTPLRPPAAGAVAGCSVDAEHAAPPSPERRDIMRWQCGTLHENWYVAALSRQVTDRKPFASVVLEEPLVLFRGADGRAAALRDRCLHRNAALSGGDVFGGCIGCPYHGWTYDSTGACVSVPSEGPRAAPHAGRRLERFPTLEQDGLVWVYMGEPEGIGERVPFAFPHVGEAGWSTYVMLTAFDGDVTDLVENFMDVPHTAFVHRGWFRRTTIPKRAEATVERTGNAVHVEYFQPDDSIGFSKWLLNPDGRPMTHTDRFFMPNVTRVDYLWGERRGFVITSQITPVGPERALVYTAITFRFGVFNPVARLLLPAYTRIVIDQDVAIMANQTANLRRYGGRRFNGTEADVIHRAIEALRGHARDGEPGPAPAPFATRISFWM
jgi:phenylpropionate dioxygenase-like ring-hydroxylating dioxygenase large terminal subunit